MLGRLNVGVAGRNAYGESVAHKVVSKNVFRFSANIVDFWRLLR